jgi:hypothetical protein
MRARNHVFLFSTSSVALACVLACNSGTNGGGGACTSAPLLDDACASCANAACGASVAAACPGLQSCYCSCMNASGSNDGTCAQSCLSTAIADGTACDDTLIACTTNNCETRCGANRSREGGKARKADWRGWSKTQEERFTLHLHDAGKRSGPLRPLSSYGLDGDGGGRSYDVPEG